MTAAVGVQRQPEVEEWAGARFKDKGMLHESNEIERSIDVRKGLHLSRAPTMRKFYRKNGSPRDPNSNGPCFGTGRLPSFKDIRTLLADSENYLVNIITPGHSRPPSLDEISRSHVSIDDDDVPAQCQLEPERLLRAPSFSEITESFFSMLWLIRKGKSSQKPEVPLLTAEVTSYQDADIADILEFQRLNPKLSTQFLHCPNCMSEITKVRLRRKALLIKPVAHFDNVGANVFGTRESSLSGDTFYASEEEILELEFENVKPMLATHSIHCPNCDSEITKVALCRKVLSYRPTYESECEQDSLIGCLSCLISLYTCSDDWCFNPFDIFKQRPESSAGENVVELEFQKVISKLTTHSMYCLDCTSEVREVILHQKLLSTVADSGPKPDPDPDHVVSVSSPDSWSFDPFDGDEIVDVESEQLISKLTTHSMHCLNCKSRIRNVALIKKELLTQPVDPAVADPDTNPDHDLVGSFSCLSLFTCSDNGWSFNPFDIFQKIQESSDEENTNPLLHENGTSREPYLY